MRRERTVYSITKLTDRELEACGPEELPEMRETLEEALGELKRRHEELYGTPEGEAFFNRADDDRDQEDCLDWLAWSMAHIRRALKRIDALPETHREEK